LARQNTKSKALVEANGLIVLGIHEKCERGGIRLQSSASLGASLLADAAWLNPPGRPATHY